MRNKKAFISILLSYILIMLIPMIILSVVIFNFFYNFYNREALSNRANNLHRMQITVDSMIDGMHANAYIIFNSSEFSTEYQRQKYGNFYDAIWKLSDIVFTNSLIDDAFYINDELKRVFTTQMIYDYNQFMDCNMGFNMPEEGISGLLKKGRFNYWLPTSYREGLGKILTYVVTNKIGPQSPKSSMAFQIHSSTLDKLTGEFATENGSCITICDYQNNLIYTSNPEISNLAWRIWQEYSDEKADQPINLDINGKMYVFHQNNSTVSSLKYISITPYEVIIAPIKYYNMFFIIGVIVVALVCSLFIFFFMRINYTPIRSLSKLAASIFGEPQGNMDEFETTEKALIGVYEHNSYLMCDKVTLKLMRGGYDNLEDFEKEGRKIGYKLVGPFFRVIGFNISHCKSKEDILLDLNLYYEISRFIENTLSVYVDACAVDYVEADTVYVVVSGLQEDLRELGIKLEQIKNVIENAFGVIVSIGVGNIATIDHVMDSSSQATIASKHQIIRGRGSIVFYKDIVDKSAMQFVYPYSSVDALYNAIRNGDGERVQFAMESLIKYISDVNSLFFGTCLAYDILNTTMKAMRELNYSFSSLNESTLVKKGTLQSIDEVIHIVNMITNEIVSFLSSRGEVSKNDIGEVISTFEQIMQYISEHYMEENFSLKALADYFGMSISNLSHYFKKHAGQTPSDYISLLRLNKAKELLRTTDMNLQDIASMCGYLHLSTFMRQFKRHEAITPSSYRAEHRY